MGEGGGSDIIKKRWYWPNPVHVDSIGDHLYINDMGDTDSFKGKLYNHNYDFFKEPYYTLTIISTCSL